MSTIATAPPASAPTAPDHSAHARLDAHGVPAAILASLAAAAPEVDATTVDLRPAVRALAAAGRSDLGLPGSAGTLTDQAAVLVAAAERCVATAFSLWGQRMASEYVALHGGAGHAPLADGLRRATTTGVSAMAAAFRHDAGLAPLPIAYRCEGEEVVLDGVVSWASNLHDDAVVVTAARPVEGTGGAGGDGAMVVAVPVSAAGVVVRPAEGLLALGSTRSGSLQLTEVRVPEEAVVTYDAASFVEAIRRPFLVLQSAFCLGLGRAALAATTEPSGVATAFGPERRRLIDEQHHLEEALVAASDAALDLDRPGAPTYLRLRLDAALFTAAATRLELCLTGGRGYVATSATARRAREAMFLPVQSPTESELRWLLTHSA